MKFLFDCEDEILLPKAYALVDSVKEFLKKVKEADLGEGDKLSFKDVAKNLMVKYPKDTSELLAKFWVLENEEEKAPNALKTMSTIFKSEDAIDFFTSVIPSIMELSNVLSKE